MELNKQKIFSQISGYFYDKPVQKVSVFGSYARGEQDEKSDIDIAIVADSKVGLFELAKFKVELEELLGIHVDLGTEDGISKLVLPFIKKDIITIYEK